MTLGKRLLERCARLSDRELIAQAHRRIIGERKALVRILAVLGEMDARNIALPNGYPSLFAYCLKELGYCERTAYRRLAAAKACRKLPELLDRLESGRIHLSAVTLLGEHLTAENLASILSKVEGATLAEIRRVAAEFCPEEPRGDSVRTVAVRRHTRSLPGSAAQETLPLDHERTIQEPGPELEIRTVRTFSCSDRVEAKIQRARALLRHRFPQGGMEDLVEAAFDALLDQIDPDRDRAIARPPRPLLKNSRRVPRWVRRAVWKRDGGCCAFVGSDGKRCGSSEWLEYDHIRPWAAGGRSDDPDNIRILCRAHNHWLGERRFGAGWRAAESRENTS